MKMQTVHVEGIYEHYKNKKHYEVIDVAEHTESGEYLVIYHCFDDVGKFGSRRVWARPKSMFEEGVEVDGKMVPRFKLLSNIVAR